MTQLVIGSRIYLMNPPSQVAEDLSKTLRMLNPLRLEAKKSKRYYHHIPEYIEQVFYTVYEGRGAYSIPRGYLTEVKDMLRHSGVEYEIIDQRIDGKEAEECEFNTPYDLLDYQLKAVKEYHKKLSGCIIVPARGGKTTIASKIISDTNLKTLWITHNKPLFNQTHKELEKMTQRQWRRIGGGKNEFTMEGDYFIGMVQTLKRRPKIMEWVKKNVGLIIIDECHHTPSSTFLEVLEGIKCKRIVGLTATPFRQDGMDFLIKATIGDFIYEVDIDKLKSMGRLIEPKVFPVYTEFTGMEKLDTRNISNDAYGYTQLVTDLTQDFNRNELILHGVLQSCKHGMVLSKRVEHIEYLYEQLKSRGMKVRMIHGATKNKEREVILRLFKQGKLECIVASIQLVQEGLDLPNLEQLYFATPLKGDSGKKKTGSAVQQALSRVMTVDPKNPDKKAEIYFFVDYNNSMLKAQWYSVRKVFSRMGIDVPKKKKRSMFEEFSDLEILLNLEEE